MRSALTVLACLLLAGCGSDPIPVVPVTPPNPVPVDPGPTPPGPGPVIPPEPPPTPPNPPTGGGTVTEAQYAAVAEGVTELSLRASIGGPFRTVFAAGYRILEYRFDADHMAFFWINDQNVVERKSRR